MSSTKIVTQSKGGLVGPKRSLFGSTIPETKPNVDDTPARIALHNFLKKSARDNYIIGAQSGKFMLFTAFLYFILVAALFGYDILIKMDSVESSTFLKTSSTTIIDQIFDGAGNDITDTIGLSFNERVAALNKENKISTAQLSNTTLANIGLVIAVAIFGLLWILKWTRPIPYEFAFFVVAIWIVFGTFARTECVCCSSSGSSIGTGTNNLNTKNSAQNVNKTSTSNRHNLNDHIHPIGTYVFDAVNHWMHTSGLCDNLTLITALHSTAIIIMIALLYVAIYSEYDYFRTEKIARKKLRDGTAEKDTESMMLLTDSSITSSRGLTSLDVPWIKIILIIVVLVLALIPFACNNAIEIAMENYFLRIILFLFIFLIRLVNSYSGRYILLKFSIAFNALLVLPDKGRNIDPRIAKPPDDESDDSDTEDELDEDELYGDDSIKKKREAMKNNSPDATSVVASQAKTQLIARDISRLALINVVIDSLIASLVLIVCGWFLLIAIIQILYEFVILYNALERYGTMSRELQVSYNKAQKALLDKNVSSVQSTQPPPSINVNTKRKMDKK